MGLQTRAVGTAGVGRFDMSVPSNDGDADGRLGFSKQVIDAFSFLHEHGFRLTEVLPTLVTYVGNGITIDVYYGRSSFEIGVGASFRGVRYSLSGIIDVMAPGVGKSYKIVASRTSEDVASAVANAAELVKEYLIPNVLGSGEFWNLMERARKQAEVEYELETLAAQLRPRADDAFARHDYATAAELYARILPSLSEVERKKLAYARRNVNR